MKRTGWGWTECRRRGFTVIEMVMVCVLIGLVAGIAIPKFDINRYRGDGAARVVRVLLQEAERNAITRQSNVIVSFDLTYNRLRIVQDYNNNGVIDPAIDVVQYRKLPEGAHFATPTWAGINGTTPGAAITGAGMQTVSGMNSVIFRRDGSASSDIEMYITNRDGVQTDYRGLLVTGSTGRSDWYTWNGQAWLRKSQ